MDTPLISSNKNPLMRFSEKREKEGKKGTLPFNLVNAQLNR